MHKAAFLVATAAWLCAASLVAASAAELPNHKPPPKQAAKKCTVNGVDGVLLAGTDSCVRISGGVGVETIYQQRR